MKILTPDDLEKKVQKRANERRQEPLYKRIYYACDDLYSSWQLREFYKRTWILTTLKDGFDLIMKRPYRKRE